MSAWEKFWNKFIIFGNISAGIIGIYLCGRVVKLILDTLVHGYALHTVYGWSVYLIGAIWDSLTQLLLHLGRKKTETENASAPALEVTENNDIRLSDLQPRCRNENESERAYPLLPSKETSTYTFELKG